MKKVNKGILDNDMVISAENIGVSCAKIGVQMGGIWCTKLELKQRESIKNDDLLLFLT